MPVITPKGTGFAVIYNNYGVGINDTFVVCLDDTREHLSFMITDCKGVDNHTFGIVEKTI